MGFRLVKILVAILFLIGSGCALGPDVVPETLQSQVNHSVTFPKMLENPENYQGTVVILGGEVLSAKRLEGGTRLKLLQLPLDGSNEPVDDRMSSQGRFFAFESSFLDPATLPLNTRVTLVGEVEGVTEAKLDEMVYRYPILTIKHLHVWPEQEFDQSESSGPSFGIFGGGSSGGRSGGGVSIGIGF